MIITKFLGIQDLSLEARSLMKTYFSFALTSSFLMSISATFFSLNAIDKIGFALTGAMMAVMLLTQLIFDYPSGSLGDYIGQRWVLTIGYLCFGFSFFVLTVAESFNHFLVIAIANGFGNAQFSGALDTWLDSNYKKVDSIDSDRKIYGFARSQIETLRNIALAASYMIGGFLSVTFSRQSVFFLQVWFSLIMVLIVLYKIRDFSTIINESGIKNEKKEIKTSYITYLKGGMRFMMSSKAAFFLILGIGFLYTWTWIWGSLILFPLYFGYSGDDMGANLLRTIIMLNGVPLGLFIAKFSKKFSTKHYPLILLVFLLLFFPAVISLLLFIPLENEFNLIGFLSTIIIINITISTIYRTAEILRMRLLVDFVPSENRNSIYSLMPTITALFSVPLLTAAGQIIESFGLVAGVAVVLIVFSTGFLLIAIGVRFMKSALDLVYLDSQLSIETLEKSEAAN
ncbi:MAG: MFS transporter [Candidatus Hodarchaeota archaeon]